MQARVKHDSGTLLTIQTAVGVIPANTPFELRIFLTCRSVGVTGTVQVNGVLWIDGLASVPDASSLHTVDTTTAGNFSATFQWTVANASNTLTCQQGRVLCIEPDK
jgi:hypothetical protein